MPRTARSGTQRFHTSSPGAARTGPVNEEPRGDLQFEDRDLPQRSGDPLGKKKIAEDLPLQREREAGHSGIDQVTADDLAPETLLDEEPSHTPDAANRSPNDSMLQSASASDIGAGRGLDEAELADVNPVKSQEAHRLQRKAEEHARNPNFFEPAEAAELAARRQADARKQQVLKMEGEADG